MKKNSRVQPSRRKKRIITVIVSVVLFVIMALLFWRVGVLEKKVGLLENENQSMLIGEAESYRYSPVVVDAEAEKVYIPSARIVMLFGDKFGQLRHSVLYDYRVWPGNNDFPVDLILSTSNVVGNRHTQEKSPNCDKMVRLSSSPDLREDEEKIMDIVPAKGKFRYLFRHIDCKMYSVGEVDALVEMARSASIY